MSTFVDLIIIVFIGAFVANLIAHNEMVATIVSGLSRLWNFALGNAEGK